MTVVREICLSRLCIQLSIDHHWLSREERPLGERKFYHSELGKVYVFLHRRI